MRGEKHIIVSRRGKNNKQLQLQGIPDSPDICVWEKGCKWYLWENKFTTITVQIILFYYYR